MSNLSNAFQEEGLDFCGDSSGEQFYDHHASTRSINADSSINAGDSIKVIFLNC